MIERRSLREPSFTDGKWRVWTEFNFYTGEEVHRIAMRPVSPEIVAQMSEIKPSRLERIRQDLKEKFISWFNLDV